jgi:hypothetical protein
MKSLRLSSLAHRAILLLSFLQNEQFNLIFKHIHTILKMSGANGFYCCQCGAGPFLFETYSKCINCHWPPCGNCPPAVIPKETYATIGRDGETSLYGGRPTDKSQYGVFESHVATGNRTKASPLLFKHKSTTKVFTGPVNGDHMVITCCQCNNSGLGEENGACQICGHSFCGVCDMEIVKS